MQAFPQTTTGVPRLGGSRDIPGTGAVDIDQGREPPSRPGPNMRNCALSGETASRMSPYPDMWSYLPACLNSTRSDIFERDSPRSDFGGALARTHCAAACVAPNRKDVRWDRLRQPWRDRCWEASFGHSCEGSPRAGVAEGECRVWIPLSATIDRRGEPLLHAAFHAANRRKRGQSLAPLAAVEIETGRAKRQR